MLNVGIISEEEFNEILETKQYVVCDFSATWCAPCRLMAPVLEDVSDKYSSMVTFYQIDIDSADDLAQKYEITAVPTVVIFKSGKEIGRTSGYQEKEEFEAFLLKIIKSN